MSIGFRNSVSLLPAIQATGLLILAPAGLSPAEQASLGWTHNPAGRFPAPGSPVESCGSHTSFRLRPAGGSCEPWHPAHTLALAGRCVVRPVDALTTATARVVPFACACDDVWHSCSFIGVIGHSTTPGACSLSPSLPPEAPSLGRHCPASTVVRASPPPWPARPCPHGRRLARATPPAGLPVLRPLPSSMRAAATTPAERVGACVARFPTRGSLPRRTGGSASALLVSRPAQRSESCGPHGHGAAHGSPFPSKCFRRCRYLHHPLRLLPAGATVAGRDSHPLRSGAFSRRTVRSANSRREARMICRATVRVIEHGPDPRRADPERCTAPPAPQQHPRVGR